jgi:hypothetical protein
MSCQCVACCEVSITKMRLCACTDPVDVLLHDVLVVCTSGSTEFLDKSYNSFVVSVESLATFDKSKSYPYIINNKIENLRTIRNRK